MVAQLPSPPSRLPCGLSRSLCPPRSPQPSRHREDKWPHSGTPCQSCLSKTKLCSALREKQLTAAWRAGGLVGANCRGFVNGCQLPQRQQTGGSSPLGGQAAWEAGALFQGLGRTSSWTPAPTPPPPSQLSTAECGGGTWLPSFCRPPGPGQVKPHSREGLWISSPSPWELLMFRSV